MNNGNGNKIRFKAILLFLLEVAVVALFTFFLVDQVIVTSGVGGNVTVTTSLTVGEVAPEILNITANNFSSSITLTANSSVTVTCQAIVREFNNDTTLSNVTGQFFDNSASIYGNNSDNNYHYTNNTCVFNHSFSTWNGVTDDDYLSLATCTFGVYYYASPTTWNCTMFVNDTSSLSDLESDIISISELLAVGVPDTINYGTVNATFVSDENVTNVTNFGNVKLNLSLSGYGVTEGDNLSMDCTLGSVGNISINYEKFNLTESTAGALTLTQFEGTYVNLSSTPTVKTFALNLRHNDTSSGIDDYNETYWRMYVPVGVAGTCNGTIVFGATTAVGS